MRRKCELIAKSQKTTLRRGLGLMLALVLALGIFPTVASAEPVHIWVRCQELDGTPVPGMEFSLAWVESFGTYPIDGGPFVSGEDGIVTFPVDLDDFTGTTLRITLENGTSFPNSDYEFGMPPMGALFIRQETTGLQRLLLTMPGILSGQKWDTNFSGERMGVRGRSSIMVLTYLPFWIISLHRRRQ